MNRYSIFILCSLVFLLTGCSSDSETDGVRIVNKDGSPELQIDGKPIFIKGVGGSNNLNLAKASGANAFRTWDTENIEYHLGEARENNMYVMMGIKLSKHVEDYHNEAYKEDIRSQVRALAETYKDDKNIFAWGLGNEIDIIDANVEATWLFVEELAQLIKSIDKRHLVATVTSHKEQTIVLVAKYAPSLDFIGINSYGKIGEIGTILDNSDYKGAFIITEWGPTGFWQVPKTAWEAPIEETSEEKRSVFEYRYNNYIAKYKNCLGSFVFLWGQKEERTPTWYSMFVEKGMEGLPLNGEKTPMVEAMQRVWNQKEPDQTAPVIHSFHINGITDNVTVSKREPIKGEVLATDRENENLTYVWEVLKEATVLGIGGSPEPRPDRVGSVATTDINTHTLSVDESGHYRLYVYVSDNTGFTGTANIPFRVK